MVGKSHLFDRTAQFKDVFIDQIEHNEIQSSSVILFGFASFGQHTMHRLIDILIK